MEVGTKKKKSLFAEIDMTSGNLFWKIVLFALPLGFTTVLQLLYTSVDLITVSQGDSPDSMAAIGATNVIVNLIVVVFQAMALGSNVCLAQAKGAGDHEKAQKVLHTSLWMALISGVVVGLIGYFVAPYLLEAIGTEEAYLEKSSQYLEIYFLGLPALMLFNYCAQMLRAEGDAKAPFIALTVAGLTNVAFDCLFVFAFKMSVAGVAYATIMAQALSAIIVIIVLFKSKSSYVNIHLKELKIDKETMFDIIRIGLPAGLQRFFFSLPNIFVQSALYTIDPGNTDLTNGAIAAGNIEGYVYAMIEGLTLSCLSFTAQNLGAKKGNNIKKVFIYAEIWGLIYCALAALVIGLFNEPLLYLLVDSPESVASGRERLFIMIFPYAMNSIFQISAGSMRGQRHSTFPMITVLLCSTIVRIVYIYALFYQFDFFHNLTWLYFVYPLSWTLNSICNLSGLAYFMPRTLRKIEEENRLSPAERPISESEN
ncbi:MAG: MATE family efflux transporter [Bacillota bacterium]|nr:MATE family efflux transporter [Bacillota bacterium]